MSRNVKKPINPIASDPRQNVGSLGTFGNAHAAADGSGTNGGPSLEFSFLLGATSTTPVESENGDDQSSKCSTTASAPRMRYDLPAMMAYAQKKNRMNNVSMNNVGGSAQQMSLGNGRVESREKARGERIKSEMENSHSSMESDSRSSNCVFMQGTNSAISNGKQSWISMNYGGENGKEAISGEQQFCEERHASYDQENVRGSADHFQDDLAAVTSWEDGEEKVDIGHQMTDLDPLAESMQTFQSVQQALESGANGRPYASPFVTRFKSLAELQKVGTGVDTEIHGPSSFDQFLFEVSKSISLEFQISSLTQKVKDLEIRLDEATGMLILKELRIAALEFTLHTDKSLEEVSSKVIGQGKYRDVEREIEDLYRQKIEADVKCVALTKTIQKLRVAASDPVIFLQEQKALASEQALILNKMGESEKYCVAKEKGRGVPEIQWIFWQQKRW